MRHIGFALASVVLAASFVGCPLLKKNASTDEDDPPPVMTDAATVSVLGIGAKNEATVLRYANETPIANEPALIGKDGVIARNFPGNGPQIAPLLKGTVVAKIASYFSTGVLVMFDDPSGDGSKLIGWVSPKSFDVVAPAPTRIVIVPPRDAGAAAPRDAGVSRPDAGGSNTVTDAGGGGGALPQPPKGTVAVSPVNGKCPDNWALTQGMCRKSCSADTECVRGTKCIGRVCTSDH